MADETCISGHREGKCRSRPADHRTETWDREVGRLAGRQHGVVGRWQLRRLGMSEARIEGAIRRGTLLRIHTGAYAVGHRALSREGRWMAAVLASGPGAVLSHRAA